MSDTKLNEKLLPFLLGDLTRKLKMYLLAFKLALYSIVLFPSVAWLSFDSVDLVHSKTFNFSYYFVLMESYDKRFRNMQLWEDLPRVEIIMML